MKHFNNLTRLGTRGCTCVQNLQKLIREVKIISNNFKHNHEMSLTIVSKVYMYQLVLYIKIHLRFKKGSPNLEI